MQNLRENPPTRINQNMYALCYPYISRLSFPENHTGRNLLVIGDSYAKGIAEALGSSFDNTYLYYFNSYSGLNYNKVIRTCSSCNSPSGSFLMPSAITGSIRSGRTVNDNLHVLFQVKG